MLERLNLLRRGQPVRAFAAATRRPAAATLSALVLAGCAAVGPDYQRPAPVLDPQGFINAGAAAVNRAEPSADIALFWRGFGDAALTALVERAIEANGDVRIAQARLQEARAIQGEADAAGRPGGARQRLTGMVVMDMDHAWKVGPPAPRGKFRSRHGG